MSNNSIKYIVGIDFGHGETSAAIAELPVNQNSVPIVKDLDLRPGVKVIPSAIAITEDGKAYIGESAFDVEQLSSNVKQYVYFKQKPQDLYGDNEKAMIRFMKEVYNAIRENAAAELTDDNHQVYIASPSGWDANTRDRYLQMAKRAGLPCYGVTKESRAALICARAEGGSKVTKNDENGIVVFDMGSSTLDLTYMGKMSRSIDHGYDVGASNVDKVIYREKIQSTEAGQKFEQKYPDLAAILLFKARLAKEEYFKKSEKKVKRTINFDDIIDDENFEDERIKISYGSGELEISLAENGYIEAVEESLHDFIKNRLPSDSKINAVLMTGGASRMDFLKESITKCWSVKENKIFRDTDPSLTISRGIAEVGRMDFMLPDPIDIFNEIRECKGNGKISEDFLAAFTKKLWDKITDEFAATLHTFKNQEADCSMNDLTAQFSEDVKTCVGNIGNDVSGCMNEILQKNCGTMLQQIEKIVAAYRSQMDSYDRFSIDMNNQSFDFDIDSLAAVVASELVQNGDFNKILEGELGAAVVPGILAGIGFLMSGPLGWILGIGGVISMLFYNESEDEKMNKAMTKPLNKSQREKVFNSFAEKWEEWCNRIAEIIHEKVGINPELKKSVDFAVYNFFDTYETSLKQARILVE